MKRNYKLAIISFLLTLFIFLTYASTTTIKPPIAKKELMTFHEHGEIRIDPYFWLKQRDSHEVMAYLKAENLYTDSMMESTLPLQNKLVQEFQHRIKQDDNTVPYRRGGYFYYVRYEKDKAYPIYCRKKGSLDQKEEIFLDVNELAKGHEYYDVGAVRVAPIENLIAFAEDIQGARKYKIRFKDLISKEFLADTIVDVTASVEWANDSKTLFYAMQDPVTLRPDRIFKHVLNTPSERDKLIYTEKDEAFHVNIDKTKSKKYLLIASFKKDTSEYQILDANHPDDAFKIFTPRKVGREYDIDHLHDKFIIRTNDNAINFKLMQCDVDKTEFKDWQVFLPYDPNIYTEKFQVFDEYISIQERKKGLIQVKIHPSVGSDYYIEFDEPDYDVSVVELPEISSHELRYTFGSLKTPTSVYDFNMKTKERALKKQDEMIDYDTKKYETQRVFAKANDGTIIPISLVYRKDKFTPSQNPLLLTGYGSYGVSYDSDFNPYVISLLDRGFVYAIAHIRGGSDEGRQWYLNGKMLNKKNTFTDFIACAEHLVKKGFSAENKLYAIGGSAGGLLMGAVINMKPHLFNGVVAQVPFVDVMNTMLDASIPLTTAEYIEWGDPKVKIYYDYMHSYSPYDNIQHSIYPNMLVTAGLHDSQVQYWEAAKWVARLRDTIIPNNILLLKTTMNSGHSGASGRFEKYKEKAFEHTFLLYLEGINK